MKYLESSDNDGEGEDDPDVEVPAQDLFNESSNRKVTRASAKRHISEEDDEDDNRHDALTKGSRLNGFIASDDEDARDDFRGYSLRNRSKRTASAARCRLRRRKKQQKLKAAGSTGAAHLKANAARTAKDDDYEHVSFWCICRRRWLA